MAIRNLSNLKAPAKANSNKKRVGRHVHRLFLAFDVRILVLIRQLGPQFAPHDELGAPGGTDANIFRLGDGPAVRPYQRFSDSSTNVSNETVAVGPSKR